MGKTIRKIKIGDSASFSKTISESDVYLFAGISGDLNPVHVNAEYAKQTQFGARLVHGALTASFLSTVLGTTLPGTGTILVEYTIRFKKPVYIGDTVTVTIEAREKTVDRNRVRFSALWTNHKGEIVAEGDAVVMPPRR